MIRSARPWVVVALMTVVLGLAFAITRVPTITTWDHAIVRWCAEHRSDAVTRVFEALTYLGHFLAVLAACLAAAAALLAARAPRLAWRPLAALALVATIGPWIKTAVDRPRPPHEYWATCPAGGEAPLCTHSFGFPSGHSGQAAATWIVLALVLGARWPQHRRPFLVIGSLITLVVGVSRVVLGVHSPTDVLAGWSLGSACALAAAPWPKRAATDPAAVPG